MIFLQMSWTFNQVQTRPRRPPQLLWRHLLPNPLKTRRRIQVQVSLAVVSEIYPRLNIHWLHVYLDDSSSDEETPDVRPKIQAMMSAYFEEVKHQGFRDIRGRKSYSVNFVQNEEKGMSRWFSTIFIFKSSYSNYKTNLFRGLHHSSVVTAGSRDIDNDKLHN